MTPQGRRLRVKNWTKFQHYKNRRPPWIKLHLELLADYEFSRLQDASKWLAIGSMLLAAETENHIPDDPSWVAKKLSLDKVLSLEPLLSAEFLEVCDCLQCASKPLASRKQSAIAETETETEKRKARDSVGSCPTYAFSSPGEQATLLPPEAKAATAERSRREELDWRVEQTWALHVEARARFFDGENGYRPGREPTLTDKLRKVIREALKEHDRNLLAPELREEWVRTSAVRAAGIGLFLDPWCTAKADRNRMGHDAGARYYLEADRPWRRQVGKADPVPRFADLYWRSKDAQEQQHRAQLTAAATLQRALQPAPEEDLPGGVAPTPAVH